MAIVDQLESEGLWTEEAVFEPQPADEEQLLLVHSPAHVARVRELAARGGGWLDPDTHVSPASWDAARRAAGGGLQAVQEVAHGDCASALCLVRPPGHHATPDRAMGFCLFNNVAVAAQWLIQSRLAERIAILDFDVHHGNGTQEAFYERRDVLYISTHQYPFYPGTGAAADIGNGPGQGATANIPLPAGAGDAVYKLALETLIEPLVIRHRPDFLLVSLGFDAFWDDPLASLRLSINGGYVPLLQSTAELAKRLCGGKLVIVLEGGYHLGALGHGAASACRVLLGQVPGADPLGPPPSQMEPSRMQPLFKMLTELHGL